MIAMSYLCAFLAGTFCTLFLGAAYSRDVRSITAAAVVGLMMIVLAIVFHAWGTP